jgi:serine/threonine-protein kinase
MWSKEASVVGAVIGNYQLVRKLGEGGMGVVYLGQHALLGRRAAIKVLLPALSARPDIVNRFFNEARAVTSISDPGIVQVFDFGYHTDGSAFIVMEYLEGEALDQRLARLGRLTAVESLRLCRQLAISLAAAHAQHIIHRDLKPENVYLVADAEVASGERTKILDFGIAKLSDEHPGKLKTSTGMLMGTPVYMSPEQCRGLAEIDHRSDIYALGCVLFHLLTGRPPFEGEGPGDIISAHIREPAPAPSSRAPGILGAVDALVLRCLAKAPAERFQTMTELAGATAQVLQQVTTGAPGNLTPVHHLPTTRVITGPPAPPGSFVSGQGHPAPTTLGASAGQFTPTPMPAPPPRQRRVGLWIAGGLVVAAAGMGIAIVGSSGRGEPHMTSRATEATQVADGSSAAGGAGTSPAGAATAPKAGVAPQAVTEAGAAAEARAAEARAAEAKAAQPEAAEGPAAESKAAEAKAAEARTAEVKAAEARAVETRAAESRAAEAAKTARAAEAQSAVETKAKARTKAAASKAAAKAKAQPETRAAYEASPETPAAPAAAETKAAAAPKAAPDAKAEAAAASKAKPVSSKCSKAAFAAVYNAAAPPRESLEAALSTLRECHTSGAVNDADFNQTRDALVAKLMAKS